MCAFKIIIPEISTFLKSETPDGLRYYLRNQVMDGFQILSHQHPFTFFLSD